MTDAEMRGQDMQDAPAQHDQLATMISDLSHTGELSMLYRMAIADAITELRAECQRRIDAAVLAEREAVAAWHEAQAWNDLAQAKTYREDGVFDGSIEACMSDALLHRESAAAIRARGQK